MTSASTRRKTYHQIVTAFLAFRLVAFFGAAPLALAQGTETVAAPIERAASLNLEYLPQSQFLVLTNEVRLAHGVAALALNDELTAAAQAKAADMVAKGYWDHFRPSDQKAPWDFISESGYNYKVAGENLARGFRTPEGITKAWVASPTHLANLVSPKYDEVGYASVLATDTDGSQVILTVEMFGHR